MKHFKKKKIINPQHLITKLNLGWLWRSFLTVKISMQIFRVIFFFFSIKQFHSDVEEPIMNFHTILLTCHIL